MFGAAMVIACPTHQKGYLHHCILPKLFKMSVCELNVSYYFSGWQPCAQMCQNVHSNHNQWP